MLSLRARAVRVLRQVLPQGAKTRVRVFADMQNFALHARHSPCNHVSTRRPPSCHALAVRKRGPLVHLRSSSSDPI